MSRRRPLQKPADRADRSTKTKPRRPNSSARVSPNVRPRSVPVAARRRQPRRIPTFLKIGVGTGLSAAVLVTGGLVLLHQSYFRVHHVEVLGARHENAAAIIAAAGFDSHPPLMSVSAPAVQRDLEGFSWIASVSVQKRWPSSLTVHVVERTPVGVAFNHLHQLQFVDARGIDLGPAPLHANLPTLVYAHPVGATWPFAHAGRSSAEVAAVLPKAFRDQVAQVSEDAKGVVALKMTTPVTFVLGPATNLHAKFVAIASVIAHSTLRPGDVVDVTIPGELAVTGPPPA